MTKSNFTYELIEVNDKKAVAITDNNGAVSVTNDIENVVSAISGFENIDPADYIIVYRDSTGLWDGWKHETQSFVVMGAKHWAHAVNKYAKLEREKDQLATVSILK